MMGAEEGDAAKDVELIAKGDVESAEPAGENQQSDTMVGSEELISLDDCVKNDAENDAEIFELELGEVQDAENCQIQVEQLQQSSAAIYEANEIREENQQVEDMDLGDDDVVVKHRISEQTVQAGGSLLSALGINGVADSMTSASATRAQRTLTVGQPSVRLIYRGLTRESRMELMGLVQQWSGWQSKKQFTSQDLTPELLEDGEETYYPAFHVQPETSCPVSFWIDNQPREDVVADEVSVPVYDREFTLGSSPFGHPLSLERVEKEDPRCFNCSSYSHGLKDCPKPRDNVAIGNARKQHNSNRTLSGGIRVQTRYYQKTPGKFDDLKPGILGPETRACLGIGEYDPPPWLHRMRELGYPPGYLDEVEDEDQPSGITIFAAGEVKEEYEEGELAEKGEAEPPQRRMTAEFPGINAPIPEKADAWLWGSRSSHFPGLCYETQLNTPRRFSDSLDRRDRGPPVAEYGPVPSSHSYSSPRYSPYDRGHSSSSLGFSRSLSDRGHRSSSAYDNPTADSPRSMLSYPSSRQPQLQSLERWNDGIDDASPRLPSHLSRDRHDRHHHHPR